MVFDVHIARYLLVRMNHASTRCKKEQQERKRRLEETKRIHLSMQQKEYASFYDEPPKKKLKSSKKRNEEETQVEDRTLSGAIKVKEEQVEDSWGKINDFFDDKSEGLVIIDGVTYQSKYDIPEPVDLKKYKY